MSVFDQPVVAGMVAERAHKHGHIYRVGPAGAWRCTTHGQALIEKGGVLACRGCDLRVLREPNPVAGFAAPVKVAPGGSNPRQAGSQRREA